MSKRKFRFDENKHPKRDSVARARRESARLAGQTPVYCSICGKEHSVAHLPLSDSRTVARQRKSHEGEQ